MSSSIIYRVYGISLAVLGISGYLLTHAKSALISGLASALIITALSFFTIKKEILLATQIINILFIGVFSWRFSLALTALLNSNPEKLIPSLLLGLMALMSLIALLSSKILSKSKPN